MLLKAKSEFCKTRVGDPKVVKPGSEVMNLLDIKLCRRLQQYGGITFIQDRKQ